MVLTNGLTQQDLDVFQFALMDTLRMTRLVKIYAQLHVLGISVIVTIQQENVFPYVRQAIKHLVTRMEMPAFTDAQIQHLLKMTQTEDVFFAVIRQRGVIR